jgi:hypothetical protein
MRDLFFHPDFEESFSYKGFSLRVGSVNAQKREKISEALTRMSPETIRNRFMGSKSGFTEPELTRLTQLDGITHYALGLEHEGKRTDGIAVARIYRNPQDPKTADVGIIFVDEFQKMGLGTIMAKLLILAAIERGIERLSFSYLPQNLGIVKLVKGIHRPEVLTEGADGAVMILNLKELCVPQLKSELSPLLPEIENYHSEI